MCPYSVPSTAAGTTDGVQKHSKRGGEDDETADYGSVCKAPWCPAQGPDYLFQTLGMLPELSVPWISHPLNEDHASACLLRASCRLDRLMSWHIAQAPLVFTGTAEGPGAGGADSQPGWGQVVRRGSLEETTLRLRHAGCQGAGQAKVQRRQKMSADGGVERRAAQTGCRAGQSGPEGPRAWLRSLEPILGQRCFQG